MEAHSKPSQEGRETDSILSAMLGNSSSYQTVTLKRTNTSVGRGNQTLGCKPEAPGERGVKTHHLLSLLKKNI